MRLGRAQKSLLRSAAENYCEYRRGQDLELAWVLYTYPSEMVALTRLDWAVPDRPPVPREKAHWRLTQAGVEALHYYLEMAEGNHERTDERDT